MRPQLEHPYKRSSEKKKPSRRQMGLLSSLAGRLRIPRPQPDTMAEASDAIATLLYRCRKEGV